MGLRKIPNHQDHRQSYSETQKENRNGPEPSPAYPHRIWRWISFCVLITIGDILLLFADNGDK